MYHRSMPSKTPPPKPRFRLLVPLVYLAALVLMFEDWLWDVGAALVARIAAWPPLHALERRIAALPPWAALTAFVLPALLLFPVKLLALLAMAHGHAVLGLSVILLAKIGGAAAVARLYALTKPSLLAIAWFARWHDAFLRTKDRWIALLRASRAYHDVRAALTSVRRQLRALLRCLLPREGSWRGTRVLRRFAALRRAHRRT